MYKSLLACAAISMNFKPRSRRLYLPPNARVYVDEFYAGGIEDKRTRSLARFRADFAFVGRGGFSYTLRSHGGREEGKRDYTIITRK